MVTILAQYNLESDEGHSVSMCVPVDNTVPSSAYETYVIPEGGVGIFAILRLKREGEYSALLGL